MTMRLDGHLGHVQNDQKRELIPLSAVPEERQEFLWGKRLPIGGLSVLDGLPGSAKSSVLYDLAARLTAGRPLPGCGQVRPSCGVVLLQAEDDVSKVVRPRLMAAGVDSDRVRVFERSRFRDDPFTIPKDLRLIESAIADVGAKLVVVDPLSAFLEGSTCNERQMRRLLSPLAEMAERLQVSVVLVRHLTKSQSGPAMYRGAGSITVIGLARSGLLVGPDPAGESDFRHVLAQFKGNLDQSPALRYETVKNPQGIVTVEWLGECTIAADDLLGSTANGHQRSQLDEARYVLFSLLVEGPLPAEKVLRLSKRAGVAERTLRRAKFELQVVAKKRGSGAGSRWFWHLPDDPGILRPLHDRDLDALADRLIHGDDNSATSRSDGLFDRDRFADLDEGGGHSSAS